MIGHELTAYHGIDHARTLAIVLPGVMEINRESKKAKLLQLGERVWNITSGSENERIDGTIRNTIEFFESVGIQTKLPDYGLATDTIDKICDRFKQRGFKLGEKGNLGAPEIRLVLENRL
jgi:NADP-dependent alcohol dehydrogenase